MSTEHPYSLKVAREAAQLALAELDASDRGGLNEGDDYWVARLRAALSFLLDAEPATLGECGAHRDGQHIGHNGTRWRDGGSEDLDAALQPPGYSLPAGELGWDEPLPPFHSKGGPQCAAKETPSGFVCTAQPDHAGPLHVAYGFDGEICHSWLLTADAPAERAR